MVLSHCRALKEPCSEVSLKTKLGIMGIMGECGNPLQCSCLENPRDGGAWRAAVYGVAQSWTQLKRFSSSSSKLTAVKMSCKKRDSSPQRVSFTEVLDQEGAARPLGGTKLMPQERGNRCHLCKKSVLKML